GETNDAATHHGDVPVIILGRYPHPFLCAGITRIRFDGRRHFSRPLSPVHRAPVARGNRSARFSAHRNQGRCGWVTGARTRRFSMFKRLLTAVFAVVALAALATPALAKKNQLSIFQDDFVLRGSGNDARTAGLNELDGLGVDVVKVTAMWRTLAPGGNQKPAGFDGADPADYSATAWAPYDDLIRDAQAHGMRVMLMLGGLAPDWASKPGGVPGSKRPDVGEFRKFVKAVGTRYSGSYTASSVGDT